MSATIELTDVRLDYVPIAEARQMTGLRLVLGAYAVPGPWREACKGIFHVKGIPFVSVATANADDSDLKFGMGDADRELREWTGQSSAPVAVWNDERPRAHWIDQLHLAERIHPAPALIPAAVEDRALMFGLAHELCGEHGLAWTKRLVIIDGGLKSLPPGAEGRAFFEHLAAKYGYDEASAALAPARMAAIIAAFAKQLARQQAQGRRFLIGEHLTALDIYWATFISMFDPLSPEHCPMGTAFRAFYSNPHPETQAVLTRELLAHRDAIYRDYLEFPIVF